MALSKLIETDSGGTATYWRIIQVNADVVAGTAWFVLAGYRDEAARQDGKKPMMERPFTAAIPEETTVEDMTRNQLYSFVKAQEEWADAEDA